MLCLREPRTVVKCCFFFYELYFVQDSCLEELLAQKGLCPVMCNDGSR